MVLCTVSQDSLICLLTWDHDLEVVKLFRERQFAVPLCSSARRSFILLSFSFTSLKCSCRARFPTTNQEVGRADCAERQPRPRSPCTKAALASRAKANWPMRSFSSGCTSWAARSHSRRRGRQAPQGKAQRTLPMSRPHSPGPAALPAPTRGPAPRRHHPPPRAWREPIAVRETPTAPPPRVLINPMPERPVSDSRMRRAATYQEKGGACGGAAPAVPSERNTLRQWAGSQPEWRPAEPFPVRGAGE